MVTREPFTRLFRETEVVLSSITHFFISLPVVMCFQLSLGIVAALITKELLISSKATALAINIVAFVGESVFVAVYVMAFFIPMMGLVDKLK